MIISHSDMMFYGLFLVIARFVKGSGMNTTIKRKVIYAGMVLLCAAMLVFCMTDRAYAAGDVNLDAIKDVKFKNYVVSSFDSNKDGKISETEAAEIAEINVHNMGITSLEGIEMFPNLETLICGDNNLTSLDVSQNAKLKVLMCPHNKISALNLTSNNELTDLNCFENELTDLDLSKNLNLESLTCGGTSDFGTVDLSHNTALTALAYIGGSMREIDLSHNTELMSLWISTTPLEYLDISDNRELTSLTINITDLHTINMNNNDKLQYVNITSDRLISFHGSTDDLSQMSFVDQRPLIIEVPAGQTSYDLKNIDPLFDPAAMSDISSDPEGISFDGTIARGITDNMKITYTYTENGVELHASIIFTIEESSGGDPSEEPGGDQETKPDGGSGQGTVPGSDVQHDAQNAVSGSSDVAKSAAQTGDDMTIMPWIILIVAAAAVMIITIVTGKRRKCDGK